ncbi:GntR family transcriptional regulator [Gordonia sp. CPCC 206044]|uniref:GntR family transcriptional regulator n=1 Tax=Gordonia sp. CPCC 206044 TaxID=3140793 RepID=UPI003AF3EA55
MATGPPPTAATDAEGGRPLSARDEVYEIVRTRLTSGHYGPEDALVPGTLSAEFAVSRTPVREALGLLERDGLLKGTSRGFVPWIRSDEEVLEIFEVRAILDSSAAAAAAQRRTDVDLARLGEISQRARDAGDIVDLRAYLNLWHDAVRRAAHNDTISSLLHTLEAHVKVAAPWHPGDSTTTRPAEDRLAEHDAVLAAIVDRDSERARTCMLDHLAHDQRVRVRQRALR